MGRQIRLMLVFVFVFSFYQVKGQEVLTINLDNTFQTIDGFGASDAWRCQFIGKNWPMHKRNKIADLLFSREFDDDGNPEGIGLSIWRFYIGSGSAELGDSSDIRNEWRRSECFLNVKGEYDWSKQEGEQWFLRAAKERGVEQFLGFSIAAPVFWSVNGKGYSIKGDNRFNLKPGKYDDYAAFLVDVLEHFEKEGITFEYLSPFNEPQWDWSKSSQEGTAATNGELYLFMKYISQELANSELSTQIVPGEAGALQFLYSSHGKEAQGDQIDVFFSENSPLYIGGLPHVAPIISGHSYFTTWPVSKLVEVRQKLNTKLSGFDNLKYWQTEFCILEKTDEIGGGHQRDLGMNTALYIARVIHADLTLANAASWQWWTAITQHDYKDGLIYINAEDEKNKFNLETTKYDGVINESKLLWAFGNFSRFVRPGMVRVGVDLDTELTPVEQAHDLMVSSYYNKEDGSIALVLINQTESNRRVTLSNKGIHLSSSYTTAEKKDLEFAPVRNNKIKLPPRSVTTILGMVK